MLLTLILACHRGEAPEPAATPDAPAVTATASQTELLRALSVRDPAPDCASVAQLSPTALTDLVWVVEHAPNPPWASLRAAACVARLYPAEGQASMVAWMGDPEMAGVARVLLDELPAMPSANAEAVKGAALAGPHAEVAREKLGPEAPAPGL